VSFAAPEPPPGWFSCRPGGAGYPRLLATVRNPPALVVRGSLPADAVMVAVVGARRCSGYGEEVAYEMARDLAAAGVTVVSGLARGIDAAAHQGALDGGGATVAVMGTGPDAVYPPEHRALAGRIASSGALVTQFPVGTAPAQHNFPTRNATISGLAVGVVVVEARRRSGAMLTAGAAGDQGRVVMAVPGSVRNPASRGCHDLLRDGAHLVTSAQEVLTATRSEPLLEVLGAPAAGGSRFGDARDDVLRALRAESLTLDELVARIDAPIPEVVTAVARLRLDERIRLRAGAYGLARPRS
jgi:DNA processing protein